jgi:hypothetical protein
MVRDRITELVEEFGWAVVGTTDFGVSLTYTVGFVPTLRHPDIVILGVASRTATVLLNDLGHRLRDGAPALSLGRRYDSVIQPREGDLPMSVAFLLVTDPEACFGVRDLYYGGRVRTAAMLQLVWPDKENHLPWEPGFDNRMRASQPILGEHW